MNFMSRIGNVVIGMFNRIKAWFVNIEIGSISMFNTTRSYQLYIVCDTIERLQKFARKDSEKKAIRIAKRIIKNRMESAGQDKAFDKFLISRKLMERK